MKVQAAKSQRLSSNRLSGTNKQKLQLLTMLLIPMGLVFLFNYVPMFGIIIAFKDYKYNLGIFGSEWVGFKNFEFLIKSSDFLRITRNTIGLNVLFMIVDKVTSVAIALLLYEVTSRRRTKLFQTIMITPRFLSWVVVSYMAYAFLHPSNGFINNIFGIDVNWYSEPNAWPGVLSVVYVWKHVGMNSILYYATLMGMDESLLEAASLDGANKWQKTIHIMLPSLIPILCITIILNIGSIFRADFGLFYQVTRDAGQLYPTTDVMDTYIYRTMQATGNMGMSSAAGLLQSCVCFVFVVASNAIVKKISPENSLF